MNLMQRIHQLNKSRLADANRNLPFTDRREIFADLNRSRAALRRMEMQA